MNFWLFYLLINKIFECSPIKQNKKRKFNIDVATLSSLMSVTSVKSTLNATYPLIFSTHIAPTTQPALFFFSQHWSVGVVVNVAFVDHKCHISVNHCELKETCIFEVRSCQLHRHQRKYKKRNKKVNNIKI